jgi:hypothetical protein
MRFDLDSPTFRALDPFVQGYLSALFYTECPGHMTWSIHDLNPEDLAEIVADCVLFQRLAKERGIASYLTASDDAAVANASEDAGTTFLFARNRDTTYWDVIYPHAQDLTALAKTFPRQSLAWDDGDECLTLY